MSDVIRLSAVTLDCPDARDLATFYAAVTGGTVTSLGTQWATVRGPNGRIDFQTVPGYTPPVWPDPTSSIMMHLDFLVTDRAATEARVLAAGATKCDFQPNSGQCFVYADPAGHPFCLTTWDGTVAPGHDPM
jgi:catechol-2,3-dioxygenase